MVSLDSDKEKGEGSHNELEELYAQALKRYQTCVTHEEHNHVQAKDDAGFVTGKKQWEFHIEAERKLARRPTLTVNHLKPFVRQVANEIRMQPPSIRVTASEEGDVKTAEVHEGLIRAIERKSCAKRVYSSAAMSAASCGMGFWRIDTEYENDDGFDQTISIKYISNPYTVYFDPMAEDLTRRDARFAFVAVDMDKEEFEATYKDEDITSFQTINHSKTWADGEVVTVCEYWLVVKEPDTLLLLSDGTTVYASNEAALQKASANGLTVEKSRKTEKPCIYQYIMSGRGIIGKPKKTAFSRIPIIPVWGEEFFDGDKVWRSSVITDAKDLQRAHNYWQSAAVEKIALAPKAPWLVTGKQIQGYEAAWKTAATGNPAYLPYNFDEQAGKPDRLPPTPMESGMLQQAAVMVDAMKSVTGIYDASLGARSNETSGKAILARQREGDVGTYAFVDNVMAAIEETGREIVSLIPKLYDVPRRIRILGKKMEAEIVEVNNGEIDLSRGTYDVVVGSGNSLASQRQEAAEMFVNALQSAPQLAPVLIPRLINSMDLPDAEEIGLEIKNMMQPQAPQAPQAPQPNPKDMAMAQKYAADAEGQQLANAAAKYQMGLTLGHHKAILQGHEDESTTPPAPMGQWG